MAEQVLVIGTDPPCPRCDLVNRMVEEYQAEGNEFDFVHLVYDSDHADAIGNRFNRRIGTEKDVAKAAGIRLDWKAVYAEIEQAKIEAGPGARPADAWTAHLDKLLEPCRKAAEEAGWLMTPVLIIDGEVKHHGSVPDLEKVHSWLAGNR